MMATATTSPPPLEPLGYAPVDHIVDERDHRPDLVHVTDLGARRLLGGPHDAGLCIDTWEGPLPWGDAPVMAAWVPPSGPGWIDRPHLYDTPTWDPNRRFGGVDLMVLAADADAPYPGVISASLWVWGLEDLAGRRWPGRPVRLHRYSTADEPSDWDSPGIGSDQWEDTISTIARWVEDNDIRPDMWHPHETWLESIGLIPLRDLAHQRGWWPRLDDEDWAAETVPPPPPLVVVSDPVPTTDEPVPEVIVVGAVFDPTPVPEPEPESASEQAVSIDDNRDEDGLLPHHRERLLLKAGHSISVNRGCRVRSILPSEPDTYPPGMSKFARAEFGASIRYDYCSLTDPNTYVWSQLRPDLAEKVLNHEGEPHGKYQQAALKGRQQRLMAHPDMVRRLHDEQFEDFLLVEGTHQHLAGVRASMAREERVVFGIAGCFGWSIGGTGGDPVDDLRLVLAVPSLKRVIVALDADRNSNRMVWTAADRLRHAIRLAGKKALFLNLPDNKKNDGLDDVLARAGRPLPTPTTKDA